MNKWGKKSYEQYKTLHPDLQVLADYVLAVHDCSLFQGHRGEKQQNEYFKNGTSSVKFPFSKHNILPSNAVDMAPYIPSEDPYDMERVLFFAGIVIGIANKLYDDGLMEHRLRWGGTWRIKADEPFAFDRVDENGKKGFFDGVHFELVT